MSGDSERLIEEIELAVERLEPVSPDRGDERRCCWDPGDCPPSANFQVEIDGVARSGFQSISGPESEIEIIEYRDGDDPVTRKRPGRTRYSNIVLRFDLTEMWPVRWTGLSCGVDDDCGGVEELGFAVKRVERK